jgi:TRAP-type C4-dicarboxylate transport system permease small subunit
MIGIVVVTALQVFSRYVLGSSFMWTEELARTLGIWCVMLCTGIVLKYNEHVGFDLIPESFKPYQLLLTNVVAVFFSIMLIKPCLQHLRVSFGRLSPAMRVPLWIMYIPMIIGFFNILLWGTVGMVNSLRSFIQNAREKENR